MSHYEKIRCIGRGHYGSAWLVRDTSTSELFVIKYISMDLLSAKEKQQTHQEVRLLSSLQHCHIVRYREEYIQDNVLHLVMEYCEGGDLAARIKERRRLGKEPFEEQLVIAWLRQMTEGLQYIHQRRVLHRDLKSSNIFLSKEDIVKIGDFGIARVLESTVDQAKTVVGTPHYLSPEVCQSKPYSYKSDIWALGCVLYELLTLRYAFESDNLLRLVYMIVKEKPPAIPPQYSQEMQKLLGWMLMKRAEDRPNARQILESPLFDDKSSTYPVAPEFSPVSPNLIDSRSPAFFSTKSMVDQGGRIERHMPSGERAKYRLALEEHNPQLPSAASSAYSPPLTALHSEPVSLAQSSSVKDDMDMQQHLPHQRLSRATQSELSYSRSLDWLSRPLWDRDKYGSSGSEQEDDEREGMVISPQSSSCAEDSQGPDSVDVTDTTAETWSTNPCAIDKLNEREVGLRQRSSSTAISRLEAEYLDDNFEKDSLAYSEDFHSEEDNN